MNLSIFVDGNFEPSRKCIYNRSSYSMKSTRNFISSFVKFSTSMEDRIYGFKSRFSSFWMDINRNSTTSWIIWCSPLLSVLPIYIPGLCLTGSNHSKTLICEASYSCVVSGVVIVFFSSQLKNELFSLYNNNMKQKNKLKSDFFAFLFFWVRDFDFYHEEKRNKKKTENGPFLLFIL